MPRHFLNPLTIHSLTGFASIILLLLCAQTINAKPKARPNVILIMADDLSAKELSCYGHPRHQTPHLDQLANTGIYFDTCYTACVCHPTRFEIMTGQYGSTNDVYHFAGRAGGPDPDSPEEQIVNHLTFGQVLKDAGYATAHAGKWQLSGKLPTLVYECGFDEYCMWAYKHNLPQGVKHVGGWEGKQGKKTSRYWGPSILKNGKYLPTTMDDYGPDIFTDFLIDFAKRHRDDPFFLYFPMALTHNPAYSTPTTNPNLKEKFRDSKKEKFQENVEYMDKLVGRMVATIEDLGLRDDTIIIFVGDNGTGLEGKNTPTERGARVPMIVNCPGRVKTVGRSEALVDTSDVMPTLVELCSASLPKNHPIDGHSFAPILRGETQHVRDWIFSYLSDGRILRTQRYLLEENNPDDFGRLYDCGTNRDGTNYRDVTDSTDPEVLKIKKQFQEILDTKPTPSLTTEQKASQRERYARDYKKFRN